MAEVAVERRQLRRLARRGRPLLAWGQGIAWLVVVVGAMTFLLTFPPVLAIMDYQRGGQESYWPGMGSLLIDHPLIYVYKVTSVNLVGTLLVWLGVVLAVTQAQGVTIQLPNFLAPRGDEHYAGGHWLASFAVYLVSERGLSSR